MKFKIIVLMMTCLFMSSCVFVSRGQQQAFQNQADLLQQRIELNERTKELLAETMGVGHPAISVIDQNTELFRISEEQLRLVFGSSEE